MSQNWEKYNWALIDNIWESKLSVFTPTRASEILTISYSELEKIFLDFDTKAIENMIDKLAKGAVLIVKNTLSEKEIEQLKLQVNDLMNNSPSSFHKMYDGVPNYWREITEDVGKAYAIPAAKKTSYFFGHNEESFEVNKIIYPKWRLFKALCGTSPYAYEGLKPSSGVVDRIQIVKYPAGSGYVAPHHDPSHNQRLIISGYPTQKGKDYQGGGFWVLTQDDVRLNVEDYINVGDFGVCYADIIHGVDKTEDGDRWFIGLMTNDSDYISDRKTSRVAK